MLEEHCFMVCRRQPTQEERQKNLAEKWHFHFFFTYPLKQLFIFIKYPQHERFLLQFHPTYDLAAQKWVRECQWIKGATQVQNCHVSGQAKVTFQCGESANATARAVYIFIFVFQVCWIQPRSAGKWFLKFIQTHLYFFFFNLTKVIR